MEVVVDRRALLAAQLANDAMICGWSDAWFGFSFRPPVYDFIQYDDYCRGYERAKQQIATSIDDEFAARHGITYTVHLQITAVRGGLRWGATSNPR